MHAATTILLALLLVSQAAAAVVERDLSIAEQKLGIAGRMARALTINGGIPGPVLRFREGDTARITVRNRLRSETTSIHWHGILLPAEQDGVPEVTTPPIPPGGEHVFEFRLRQAGTYWYHSHTGLQEQRGVYGAIVIEPRDGERIRADREEVLVLSDWTRESPKEVMRTLKRGSDWYAIAKGNAQSISGAIREGALKDYLHREKSRMPAMDISDVACEAFLINGQPAMNIAGSPGETIRLRIINAAASTYFYLHSAAGPLAIAAADGPPVHPVKVERLLIAIAETYDVLVTIPRAGSWELRASSHDGSGSASVWIGSGEQRHPAADIPRPDLYRMDETMMAAVEEAENPQAALAKPRPLSPYSALRAVQPSSWSEGSPKRSITLRLTGDMERYIWSFNDKLAKDDPVIPLQRGEIVRLELVNDTMMHHPLHLHGHFFRLVNSHGRFSPLKHTLDVPPMSKRVIEFQAGEESGDWLFHCHILYHLMSGMARIFSYTDQGPEHQVRLGEHGKDPWDLMADGLLHSNLTMGRAMAMNSRNNLSAMWEIGWERVEDTEYEIDLAFERWFSPNLTAFAGARLTNMHEAENRAVAGIWHRLPYLIGATAAIDSEGDFRFSLAKDFQLTSRLSLAASVEYDTLTEWEWMARAEYALARQLSLSVMHHSEYGFGGGVTLHF